MVENKVETMEEVLNVNSVKKWDNGLYMLQAQEYATQYRSLVSGLQYCCIIRPKLAFSLSKLCQFLSSPTTIHFQGIKKGYEVFSCYCKSRVEYD